MRKQTVLCCVLALAAMFVQAAPVTVVPGSPAGYLFLPAAGAGSSSGSDGDVSKAAASSAACSDATVFTGSVVFNTVGGPFNWTVPSTVGCIKIETAGGGGGGGNIFYIADCTKLLTYPTSTASPAVYTNATTSAYPTGIEGGNSYVINANSTLIAASPGGAPGAPIAVCPVNQSNGYLNNAWSSGQADSYVMTPAPTSLTGYSLPVYPGGAQGINDAYFGGKKAITPTNPGYTVDTSKGLWSVYYPAYGAWYNTYQFYNVRAGSGAVGYKYSTPNFKIPAKTVLSVFVGGGGGLALTTPGVANPTPSPKAGSLPTTQTALYPITTYDYTKASNAGGNGGVGQTGNFDTSTGAMTGSTTATAGGNGYVKIYY